MKDFSTFFNQKKDQHSNVDSAPNSDQAKMTDFKENAMPQSDQFKNKRFFVSKWLEKKNSM